MTLLEELEDAIGAAAQQSGPSVVGLGRGWGVGSGVVVAPGRVLTNAHNLRHDEVTVTFPDGRREQGRVAGSDGDLDVAVIEVDTGDVEPVQWPADGLAPVGRPRRAWRLAIPVAVACASPPGSCRRPRAASADLAGAGSPVRSSTPPRSRAAPPAARCSTQMDGCSGSTRSASTAV